MALLVMLTQRSDDAVPDLMNSKQTESFSITSPKSSVSFDYALEPQEVVVLDMTLISNAWKTGTQSILHTYVITVQNKSFKIITKETFTQHSQPFILMTTHINNYNTTWTRMDGWYGR